MIHVQPSAQSFIYQALKAKFLYLDNTLKSFCWVVNQGAETTKESGFVLRRKRKETRIQV